MQLSCGILWPAFSSLFLLLYFCMRCAACQWSIRLACPGCYSLFLLNVVYRALPAGQQHVMMLCRAQLPCRTRPALSMDVILCC